MIYGIGGGFVIGLTHPSREDYASDSFDDTGFFVGFFVLTLTEVSVGHLQKHQFHDLVSL